MAVLLEKTMTTVCVVDDSPDDRDWLTDMLKKAGVVQAYVFEDVASLLSALSQTQPEAILLDCWLDGYTSFAHLPKIWSAAPDATVTMISGQGRHDLSELAAKFGVGFFSKDMLDERVLALLLEAA